MSWPRYSNLTQQEWQERIEAADHLIAECRLCPRHCRARRRNGEVGACGVGADVLVSSYGPHFGEEQPLVGSSGFGTIFLTRCNLQCVFCQNSDISQLGEGEPVSPGRLAAMMLDLQGFGCANINLVTPTHQMPVILKALAIATADGLRLPIVYNCGGYESPVALQILDGIVDIYMPDFKSGTDEAGRRFSGVGDYYAAAKVAVREMHRQVGDLEITSTGVARRGLLVRHLVLPNDLASTDRVVAFLADLSPQTYVNVMGQYRPCYQAPRHPELSRRPTTEEITRAVGLARRAGLRLDGDHTSCSR